MGNRVVSGQRTLYISDTHFRHSNILKLDSRPWTDVDSMEKEMVYFWNLAVRKQDRVCILGDFIWKKRDAWMEIVPKLNGEKYLILGNHDLQKFDDSLSKQFKFIGSYLELIDNGNKVCMSHYPMIIYKHDMHANTFMFYGHVHLTPEAELVKMAVKTLRENSPDYKGGGKYQGNLINTFCGLNGWAPVDFDTAVQNGHI